MLNAISSDVTFKGSVKLITLYIYILNTHLKIKLSM